jgi:hypothetical protein
VFRIYAVQAFKEHAADPSVRVQCLVRMQELQSTRTARGRLNQERRDFETIIYMLKQGQFLPRDCEYP